MFRLRTHPVLRLALVADLVVFVVVLAIVAVLPIEQDSPEQALVTLGTNVLRPAEVLVIVMAPFVLVGLVGRLLEKPHVPANEWAYAATIFYAVAALSLLGAPTDGGVSVILVLALGLLVAPSIVGAFFGHLLDGGKQRLAPRVAAWVERDPR